MVVQGVIALDDIPQHQDFGEKPLDKRESDNYQAEYVQTFVERWDEVIDWSSRAEGEGSFFINKLKQNNKHKVLDVATGTGFHSVRLMNAGFNVTSADGSGQMLVKAFDNAKAHGHVLQSVHADWRWLNRDVSGKYDAVICLGNSFTHLFDEGDRRRCLAEFYAALKHDGILIIDQRNYDCILDNGFSTKHKYYYCGDKVVAQPAHIDDGLARFEYVFQDGTKHHLNMFPLRKDYMRGLLKDAGFQRIETYGDFQETYHDDEPDFFIHVAHKAYSNEQ